MPGSRPGTAAAVSAARHAHMTRYGRGLMFAIDDEIMAFRLAGDGLVDRLLKSSSEL